jgi:NAD dependent epimerase/dehydratase family enzyme
MKIVIPGGSGQVGRLLARSFHAGGHHVVVLSRRPSLQPWRVVAWDGQTRGDWYREVDGAHVVINLSGQSVNCRYTSASQTAILESRVRSTLAVGDAIAAAAEPPRIWLQASTATIYAHRFDAANDEWTGRLGGDEPNAPSTWDFSIKVARAWENAFQECDTVHTRKVLMRSAMTLSPGFSSLIGPTRRENCADDGRLSADQSGWRSLRPVPLQWRHTADAACTSPVHGIPATR